MSFGKITTYLLASIIVVLMILGGWTAFTAIIAGIVCVIAWEDGIGNINKYLRMFAEMTLLSMLFNGLAVQIWRKNARRFTN